MTKDKALKLALEALQKIYIAHEHEEYIRVWWPKCEQAIAAIKEALAQHDSVQAKPELEQEHDDLTIAYIAGLSRGKDLAPQREWQRLTDEEVIGIGNASSLKAKLTSTGIIIHPDGIKNFAQTIEAKLKEKNT